MLPLQRRYDVAAALGMTASWNAVGAKAAGELLKAVTKAADYARTANLENHTLRQENVELHYRLDEMVIERDVAAFDAFLAANPPVQSEITLPLRSVLIGACVVMTWVILADMNVRSTYDAITTCYEAGNTWKDGRCLRGDGNER